jgi:hypothetical protein
VSASVRGIGVAVISSTSGRSPFPAARPLRHAEAVLLVDHDEPQRVELDVVLDERMRADDQAGGAALEVRQDGVPLQPGRAASQQIHPEACLRQQPPSWRSAA